METITIKLPSIDDITYRLTALDEDSEIGDNFDRGDAEKDKEMIAYITRKFDSGNVWAWCTVKLKGTYLNFEATDYLGACSYDSETDFVNTSGYYDDMKQTVFNEIIRQMKEAHTPEIAPDKSKLNVKPLTAGQLIECLKKCDINAPVTINIKQFNKPFGVCQLSIKSTIHNYNGYSGWVDSSYQGANITVFLPDKAHIVFKK